MTKLEKHEKGQRNKNWRFFARTRKGRMSWADWFQDRVDGWRYA